MRPFVRCDGKASRRRLAQELLRGVETCEIVKKPGETGLRRIDAVAAGQDLGAARHPHAVLEAMPLAKMRFDLMQ